MDKQTYVVTKLAGPKVAGLLKGVGDTIDLTEAEARGELAAGAIVIKPETGKAVEDPFKDTDGLDDIRARARGLEKAPVVESPAPKVAKAKADAAKVDAPPGADTPPAA